MKEYKKCEDLKEEVSALRRELRELQAEHRRLNKSNSKSKWYYKRKTMSSDNTKSDHSRSVTPDDKYVAKRQQRLSSHKSQTTAPSSPSGSLSPTNSTPVVSVDSKDALSPF